MRTVILVLTTLSLAKSQSYQYQQDNKNVNPENTPEIIPNAYQGTSFASDTDTTIPVHIQQETQQHDSTPKYVPKDYSSYYQTDSFTTATEPTLQYYDQTSDKYQNKYLNVPNRGSYESTRNEPVPVGRNNRLRGASQFSENSRQSNVDYVRKEPQNYRYRNQYNLPTSTPNYFTEPIPTTTERYNRRVPQQPNSITLEDVKNSAYDETDKSIQKPSTSVTNRGSRRYSDGNAYILRYSNENNVYNGYKFGYETSNGIQRNEELVFEDPEKVDQPTIYGGYEFTDPVTNVKVIVTYTAGIHGFRPIIKYVE